MISAKTAIDLIEEIQVTAKRIEHTCPKKYEAKLNYSLLHLGLVEDAPEPLTEAIQVQIAILTDLIQKILSQVVHCQNAPLVDQI